VNALKAARTHLGKADDAVAAAVLRLSDEFGRRNRATQRAISAKTALADALAELNRQLGPPGATS
jgi:hypothetical protein